MSDCTVPTCPHHGTEALCGQRAAVPQWRAPYGTPAYYTKACILPKGHGTHHRDNDGYTWHETVR